MNKYISKIHTWNLKNKCILLRADLNIPMSTRATEKEFRLERLKPTLDYIMKEKGKIIIITHIGRPNNYQKELSTQLLIPWFKQNQYNITFAPTISSAKALISQNSHDIILVENLRFNPEEKTNSSSFAQELSLLGDFFINDAFGALHKTDTSITTLADFFSLNQKTFGLLVEKELNTLNLFKNRSPNSFLIFLGGAKGLDKIPYIEGLFKRAHTIALCPAIVFTFLKALNQPIGQSLYNKELIQQCETIIQMAQKNKIRLIFPKDYLITKDTSMKKYSYISAAKFNVNDIGLSIGPLTTNEWCKEITNATTILFNGAIGLWEKPETQKAMYLLFNRIASSKKMALIAGGDSVAFALQESISSESCYMSTGGGSTLCYLSENDLPGLSALLKNGAKT